MKAAIRHRVARILLPGLCLLLMAGCGLKGDLSLPEHGTGNGAVGVDRSGEPATARPDDDSGRKTRRPTTAGPL